MLERALALRRMVIAKMQNPPDEEGYAVRLKIFEEKGLEVEKEAGEARKLIADIIADENTPSDNITLTRIDTRIDAAINDLRRQLGEESAQLISQLDSRDFTGARRTLARADKLRDEFNHKIDSARADMLNQVYASARTVMSDQQHTILISGIVTALAAILGLVFATLVTFGALGGGDRHRRRHGRYTAEAVTHRREVAALIRCMKGLTAAAEVEE